MSTDLVVQEPGEVVALPPTPPTAGDILAAAIEKGIDAEGIKALAEVYERMQARDAERLFNEALLGFQAECPKVLKRHAVTFTTRGGGQFNTKYAKLDHVVDIVRPTLEKFGFGFRFDTKITGKQVQVTCTIVHRAGHSKDTEFTAPIEEGSKLSNAHATASAVSFAQRYSFQLALGIVAGSEDDDGARAFAERAKVSAEQVAELRALMNETNSFNPKFWTFAGVSSLEEIPASDFKRVQQALAQRKLQMEHERKEKK